MQSRDKSLSDVLRDCPKTSIDGKIHRAYGYAVRRCAQFGITREITNKKYLVHSKSFLKVYA